MVVLLKKETGISKEIYMAEGRIIKMLFRG